jgi:xylan 1,4-beta-xylosidase
MNASTDAGLVVFQSEHSFFVLGVRMSSTNSPEIFVEQGSGTASAPASTWLACRILPASARQIKLRLTEVGSKLSFSYRLPGETWTPFLRDADATLLSTAKAGGFVGSFVGPFARKVPQHPAAKAGTASELKVGQDKRGVS